MKRVLKIIAALIVGLSITHAADSALYAQDGNWSTVKGRITWKFKQIPKRQPLKLVAKNQDAKACLKDGPILDETWIVNEKNKGIKDVFVWLAPMDKDGKLPVHPDLQKLKKKEVAVDQPCCMFVPHALGMREGQTLVVKNSADILHNFKWQGDPFAGVAGNVAIPAGKEHQIKGLQASRLPILMSCQIHPWMSGYVRVFDHPYFAVTDENGAFEMPKAPAGEYRLFIWHGAAGWRGGAKGANGFPVQIKGETTDLGSRDF